MSEIHDRIREAIDHGGGQCCDIEGVIRELGEAGFVIVPREPTEAMLNAEMSLGGYGYDDDDCYCADPKEVWRAMVNGALT